jgi:5-hydroxyisourate hydrolase
MSMTVHVVDCAHGRPAAGMLIQVDRDIDGRWSRQLWDRTNAAGVLEAGAAGELGRGVYRLILDADSYFATLGAFSAFPSITVSLRVADGVSCLRISIVLTGFGYFVYQET